MGDPVDVITGHNVFSHRDFTVPGDVAFQFRRNYDHTRAAEIRGLGRGYRLNLDQWLSFDVDGMTYISADGSEVRFPFLDEDGEGATSGGHRLVRVRADEYHLIRRSQPTRIFGPGERRRHLRLHALERNGARLQISYRAGRIDALAIDLHRHIRFAYAPQGLLEAVWLAIDDGRQYPIVKYTYDEHQRLVVVEDAYRQRHCYTYDDYHRMIEEFDPSGYAFLFEYDANNRCVASRGQDGLLAVRMEYEPSAGQTRLVDANGAEWIYQYGQYQELLSITDPYGEQTTFEYGPGRELIAEVDPSGRRTEYLRDHTGARYACRNPDGSIVPLQGPAPRPTPHRVPANALEWEYGDQWFSDLGLPRGPELPASLPSAAREVLTTSQGPHRGRIESVRNDLGVLCQQRLESGHTRRFVYSYRGKLRRYQDFDGSRWRLEMQRWDLPFREQDPNGFVSEFRYTDTAEQAAFIDPEGNAVTYEYDLKDRITAVLRNGQVVERYEYDRSDDFVCKRDGDGKLLLELEYDALGRLVRRALASGDEHVFEYDERGNPAQASCGSGVVRFETDVGDRRLLDLRDDKGVRRRFSGSNLAEVGILGFCINYHYSKHRELFIVDPTGHSHCIQMHGAGVFTREFANGWREVAQYGPRGWCLAKVAWSESAPDWPWVRKYSYSGEGDLLRVFDSARGEISHTYDRGHRLISSQHPDGTLLQYAYSRAGSLVRNVGLHEVGMHEAEIGPGNQMRWADGYRFTYDVRQHIAAMTDPGGHRTEYLYDSRDQMVAVARNAEIWWRADYDAIGRRTYKEVHGQRTTYFWEGDRLAAEILPDGEVRVYIYPDAFAMVPILFVDYESADADPASGAVYAVLTDQRGYPERILDAQGLTAWSAHIDPYGWAHVTAGEDFRQPLRFPGHWWDAELRLHYNRFRYYSPWLGRYLQTDPLGEQGNRNVYAYPANPLRSVDVRGLNVCPEDGQPQVEEEGKPDKVGQTNTNKPDVDAAEGGAAELGKQLRSGEIELPDSVLYRTGKRDEKGRSFGSPSNPDPPPVSVFNPRVYEVSAGDIEIGSTLHGTNPTQGGPISQLSNADLVRFRPEDPISSQGLSEGSLSVTGGHHRLAEIQKRVAEGTLPPDTPVRILLHD